MTPPTAAEDPIAEGSRRLRIATAAWSIPGSIRDRFAHGSSILARYATRFDAVEINSSFYRAHRPATYARWADSVPQGFRFAVKMPRSITHEGRLVDTDVLVDTFLGEIRGLGTKLGPILIQLPPSLALDPTVAQAFLDMLRHRTEALLAFEPRHPDWFTPAAEQMLARHRVARVAADPPPAPGADRPGGWDGLVYRRLHGSPRIYYSDYGAERLAALATELRAEQQSPQPRQMWCVFDNTALGHATRNALGLQQRIESVEQPIKS